MKNDYNNLKNELSEKKKELNSLQSLLNKTESVSKKELEKLQNSFNKEKNKLEDLLRKEEEKNILLADENNNKNLLLEQNKTTIEELKSKINFQNEITNNENIRTGKRFVLNAGKYKGGVNIPIGVYDLTILNGFGTVETNKPENINIDMTEIKEHRVQYGELEKYNGLEISEKTILKISDSANIEFTLSREYDFSAEIEELKKEYEKSKICSR